MALSRSPEYHWNQIISKSVDRLSRRSRLKFFSIYSLQQSGTVLAIFVDSHLRNIPVKLFSKSMQLLRRRSRLKVFQF